MKKSIKILLTIGVAISAYIIGMFFWRCFDEEYLNKLQVKTWIRRVEEFNKEQSAKVELNKIEEGENYQDEKVDYSSRCFLSEREMILPKIREEIGDTINIKHIYDWQVNTERTVEDKELEKIINRGEKYFEINQTENSIIIGFLENEGEYIAIYAYSIDKNNCEIIVKELLAENTTWENGYKETFSIIENDYQIKREKKTGAKDWGDGTKWKRDTVVTIIDFDERGKLYLEEK